MIDRLGRLFHTLKFLKPAQLVFFVVRRKFSSRTVVYVGDPCLNSSFALNEPVPIPGSGMGRREFRFLNVSKDFPASMDWSPADVPRLWRYNLHYFDYLRDSGRSDQDKLALILDWIAGNPQGSQPGWEPFTVSLRIVNWIFFIARFREARTSEILQSLYTQTLWLERNDERHILANHYFENLKALAFAGALFESENAERWRRRASGEIVEQLKEQILSDGGHYERTPQYHGLMLENFLDLYNLAVSNARIFSDDFSEACLTAGKQGLVFLKGILFPDGKIPLFNDSAFGVSPTFEELDAYFGRLAGYALSLPVQEQVMEFPDFGLFGYRSNNDMIVFDAGDIGPAYQPGHTHCDMLSYELMWGGERIVVDTGVSEYEPGPMRGHVRSTRAHNTVSVDGADQSEVWGEFRVARRAKITEARITRRGGSLEFTGEYRGFPALPGQVRHQRRASLALDENGGLNQVSIVDTVTGSRGGRHRVESFVHFHPDMVLEESGVGTLLVRTPAGRLFSMRFPEGIRFSREAGFYCPEFGVRVPNDRIVLSSEGSFPLEVAYALTKID